ncbi:MAG: preprotein translocase subunit SecE [Vicinamibacterales bacterium]|nr:preprotein translocase subunit SecE [Vicinamibacterales bacterium]
MANTPALPRGRTGMVQFAQECWSELQKVTWPSRETVVRLTVIVLLISALIAAYIFAFDNFFTFAITQHIVGGPGASPTPAP